MPAQQGLWGHDHGDIVEHSPAEFPSFRSQTTALLICQTQSLPAQLLLENAILFCHILDYFPLLLIHPSGQAGDKKSKKIQRTRHPR
ncbi:MAG: hypothetical protein ACR2IV_21615 [Bryobacteraceae bacterium]